MLSVLVLIQVLIILTSLIDECYRQWRIVLFLIHHIDVLN